MGAMGYVVDFFTLGTDLFSAIYTVAAPVLGFFIGKYYERRESQRQSLFQAVEKELDGILHDSLTIRESVIQQLTCRYPKGGGIQKSHKAALEQLKNLGEKIRVFKRRCSEEKRQEIDKNFLQWKSDLTSEPFPVLRRDQALPDHDNQLANRRAATERWTHFLQDVRDGCIRGEIKYWKKQSKVV